MTYSIELRGKVLLIKEREPVSVEAIAERFEVGKARGVRWSKRLEVQASRNQPTTKIDMDALKQDVKEYPDAYPSERAPRLGGSRRGIGDALNRLGMSRKNQRSHLRKQRSWHGAMFKNGWKHLSMPMNQWFIWMRGVLLRRGLVNMVMLRGENHVSVNTFGTPKVVST